MRDVPFGDDILQGDPNDFHDNHSPVNCVFVKGFLRNCKRRIQSSSVRVLPTRPDNPHLFARHEVFPHARTRLSLITRQIFHLAAVCVRGCPVYKGVPSVVILHKDEAGQRADDLPGTGRFRSLRPSPSRCRPPGGPGTPPRDEAPGPGRTVRLWGSAGGSCTPAEG